MTCTPPHWSDWMGTVDWFCAPRFDSPSVFAAILDSEKGGHFKLHPCADDTKSWQYYLPETNVLVTRFTTGEGVAEIVDFMPVQDFPQSARTSYARSASYGRKGDAPNAP